MDLLLIPHLALIAALLVVSALFAGTGVALFSLNPGELREPGLEAIRRLLVEPRRLMVTILIGSQLANMAATHLAALLVMRLPGGRENWWITLLVMPLLLLLASELLPKLLLFRRVLTMARANAPLIALFARAITPLHWAARAAAATITARMTGAPGAIVTEEMVRTLADAGAAEGILDPSEKNLIHNIFDFGNQTVAEVMTPRANLCGLSLDAPLEAVLATVRRERYTRFPVFRGDDRDVVAGILHARHLLGRDLTQLDREGGIARILHKPLLVPESKPAAELFHTLQQRRQSIALVITEYGELSGLVTMDDLMTSLFGQLPGSGGEAAVELLAQGVCRVEGGMEVAAFNTRMAAHLDEGQAQTLAGLVLHLLGEVPVVGARVALPPWHFTVTGMAGLRVVELTVRGPIPQEQPAPVVGEAP